MVQRLTYRRRKSYNTASNKVKKVRTPGGKLVLQYLQKKAKGPVCGDTGKRLPGIPALRPYQYHTIPKGDRTVKRAYGGVLSGSAVRQRILRAFLVEEQKIVKAVTKRRQAEQKKVAAAPAKPAAPAKKGGKAAPAKKAAGKAAVKK